METTVSCLLILQKYINLGNVSKYFTINNMKKKIGLKGIVQFFSVDFNPIDTNDILDIHESLMKGTLYKIMFTLIKEISIGLLTGIESASNHKKCVSLSNQKCMIQPTVINTVKNFTTIHLQLN